MKETQLQKEVKQNMIRHIESHNWELVVFDYELELPITYIDHDTDEIVIAYLQYGYDKILGNKPTIEMVDATILDMFTNKAIVDALPNNYPIRIDSFSILILEKGRAIVKHIVNVINKA